MHRTARIVLIQTLFVASAGMGVSALGAAAYEVAAQEGRTVADGVYTSEQALRGQKGYIVYCESCHAADLSGTNSGDSGAPPLSREGFMEGSDAASLFIKIRETMPFDAPASLDDKAYADILAYIFQHNGFPAGSQELSGSVEALKSLRIVRRSK